MGMTKAQVKKANNAKSRKPRRARKARGAVARPLKTYRFKFKPVSQVLTSTAGAGSLALTGGPGGFQAPLTVATFATYASTNGIAGYYDIAIAVPFKLSDINALGAYTSMFDSYKFGKVGCRVEYLNNVSLANQTGLMPSLYYYWDSDDAIIPPSLTSISSKQGVKIRQFGNRSVTSFSISGTPALLQAVATVGSGVTLGGIAKPQWINSTSTTVQHNSLKMMITDVYLPGGVATTQAFRFNWTYNLSFRDPLNTA